MKLKSLTKKQAEVLDYIIEEVEAGNGSPTIREIGARFSLKSTGSVRDLIRALVKKGYVVHIPDKARGARLNPEIFKTKVSGKSAIRIKK